MPELVRPDGCRIHFELFGSPGAPPLILLEGMGGDIPGWRRNIPHLASELRVCAYDFRGNGASDDPPGPCTMTTFVQDTVALLDELGIDRAHVYGQSFGAMVAQELALAHPGRVRTLILAATHCGGPDVAPAPHAKAPIDQPWRALYAPGFPEEHPEHVAEDLRISSEQPKHPRGERRQWEAMQGFDAHDRLPEIGLPTLVLHGTLDRLVAPANAEVLASRIPGAELAWIEGAGHLYHSERAEESDALVLDFIRRRGGHA
ncbi:MAG: alpha/beta fold hydrolase [Actinobacteria bacterium]|nr:alpha/beta fold hydrolase [Actinomycetota bacterium]